MKILHQTSIFCIVVLFISCMVSCKSKQTPINQLKDLVEDVRTNSQNYTDEDWHSFSEKYKLIEQQLNEYKDQYTDEEKNEIDRLKGVCLAYIAKYSIKSFGNQMYDAIKETKGLIEGFTDAFVNE